MKKEKSLGQQAIGRQEEELPTPIEMGEKLRDLTGKKLEKVIQEHQNYGDEYYIQIVFQQENLHKRYLPNVHHLQSIVTRSDPGMRPDRSCFKYDNRSQTLYHLWSLPDMESCAFIIENQNELSQEEKPLLEYVKKFFDQCLSAIQYRGFLRGIQKKKN